VLRRDPESELWGRQVECAALDRLLATVRTGESQVLVLRGDPGIGKTALLDYLGQEPTGYRVARAAGVESEMELAYAGLQQLCGPLVDRLENIPEPQRQALDTAFGRSAGPPPDPFLVGLAVLSLLADAAEDQPLVCLVDDAHWLDRVSARTLVFVARRLLAEPIALVFATRQLTDRQDLTGLPELVIRGLDYGAARALLTSTIRGPVDAEVADRIISETRGIPLALLELPRGLTPAELAAGFGTIHDPTPLTNRIEEGFRRRLEPLPPQTRRLLLTAAAEPVGDAGLFWRAAEHLGIDASVLHPAEAAGLIEVGPRVRFHHPLVRSAVYWAAPLTERQEVHRALAVVTDPDVDPDRRAWHRALATRGTDEQVAAELVGSAGRARARGGLAAAAAFLEYAATLTPEPAVRAQRRLAAAAAMWEAGALDAALRLLDAVEAGPPDALRFAEAERLRGNIAFDQMLPRDAARLLVDAARQLEPLDAALARETYLDAIAAAIWTSASDTPRLVMEAAMAARKAPSAPVPERTIDVVLDAFALRYTDGPAAAAPTMLRALTLLRGLEPDSGAGGSDSSLWLARNRMAGVIANDELWDLEAGQELAERQVQLARDSGAFVQLQFALNLLGTVHLLSGALSEAAEVIDEDRELAEATGNRQMIYLPIWLAALRGQESEAHALIDDLVNRVKEPGQGRTVGFARYHLTILSNGLGHYEGALDAGRRALAADTVGYAPFIVSELAEAASRTRDTPLVEACLDWMSKRTAVTATNWAVGIEARIRALLDEGEAADRHYRESISRLERTPVRPELARSHLLYGEALRRQGRRVDARSHLRTAYDMLAAMGLDGFAERANRELLATGATVRKRSLEARNELTPQEAHIARLASEGKTNPQIGAELFISSRTVEWHLRKIFTKLDITSRHQLRDVFKA
jgi:DNA-binding CsgD family transcriptional regulator